MSRATPAPDVAVIGGGLVGTATAAFLARAGARVTLWEREALAAGASGRNSGVVQHPFDPPLVPLFEESVGHYRRLPELVPEAGFRLAAEPAGLLLVSHRVTVVRALADHLRATVPALTSELLVDDALQALEPAIALGVSAIRLPIGFPIVPAAPTYAMATWAERLGVTIRLGRAAAPAIRGGRVAGVQVDGRLHAAGAVVVAAGPWSPGLIDPTGRWRPVMPNWGVVVETVLAAPPRRVIEEAAMDVALGTGDLADPVDGVRDDPATTPETSLVTAGGATAVGSTFLGAEPDPAAWTERILRRATTFVPALLDAPIRETRACARPLSADGRPLVGAIDDVAGLYVCTGHGPWGISTGPASARLVADLVLGRPVAIPSELDPARFPRV